MTNGDDKPERELESFLVDDSRVAALYRRLPKDEPDARLDAAILSRARTAIAPRRARPRWLPALSAAAALVVVAGLAYRVGPQVWNERSAVSGKAEQQAAPPPAPQKPAADIAAQPSVPASGNAIPQQAEAERADTAGIRGELRKSQEQKTAPSAFAPRSTQMEKTHASAKQSASDSTRASARSQALETESQDRMKSAASPPRLDAAPAEPAAGPPPPPAARAAPKAAVTTAFPAAGAGAARSPMRERAAKPARSAVDIEVNLYPEHWIADIRKMLKDGRRDDAIENLDAFRKHYPDYTLPDDLHDLK